jgi:phosphoribosylanthranilate isomerase
MKTPIIKICGITSEQDLAELAKCPVQMIGLNLVKGSPRAVSLARAQVLSALCKELGLLSVGIFRNAIPSEVTSACTFCQFDYAQLHGEESPQDFAHLPLKIIKAFPIQNTLPLTQGWEFAHYYLFDTKVGEQTGGTGAVFDWNLLTQKSWPVPVFVAGGLSPSNLVQAAKQSHCAGLDLNSRFELSPGKKDTALICQALKEFNILF